MLQRPMPKVLRQLSWIVLLTAVGCETAPRVGQRTTIQFGTVRNVQQVQLQSDAAAGMLVGGTIGLVASGNSRNAPRNAILGAAAGGVSTTAAQGNRTGTAYTVQMLDGSTIRIITDQRDVRVGDCVAVERAGDTNNIRREHPSFCESANQAALAAIQPQTQAAAQQCEAAKQELVGASTPEAVDIATRKISLLCN